LLLELRLKDPLDLPAQTDLLDLPDLLVSLVKMESLVSPDVPVHLDLPDLSVKA